MELILRRVPRASKLVWARTVSRNESRGLTGPHFDRRHRPLDWPMKSDPYDAHLSSSLLAT